MQDGTNTANLMLAPRLSFRQQPTTARHTRPRRQFYYDLMDDGRPTGFQIRQWLNSRREQFCLQSPDRTVQSYRYLADAKRRLIGLYRIDKPQKRQDH